MALTLSLVLAPVGLPLLWRASRHRLAAEGTVTQRAEESLGEHLSSVLRGFLALERHREPVAEFQPAPQRSASEPREIGQR